MKHLIDGQRGRAEFVTQEDGAGTVFSLLLFVSLVALGGIAVDVSNVTMARTELQVTADAVAHASLVSREGMTEANARAVGLTMAAANMTTAEAGVVIRPEEIVFGRWNSSSRTFTPEPDSRRAVQVIARQDTTNANPLATFMLRIIGFDQWDVSVVSVFSTERPSCLREGFVADGIVDIQSNNTFTDGFCIHSNTHVELNSGNSFGPDTIVSMPNENDLVIPSSGMDSNPGLRDVLRSDEYDIRILSRMDDIIEGISNTASAFYPDQILTGNTTPVVFRNRTVEQADLRTGRIHTFDCRRSNGTGAALQFGNDVLIENVVIITNCDISFGSGNQVINSIIVSESTGAQAINASSGVVIGRPDGCAAGGETQLLAFGSMRFPSDLTIYGSQLLARGDISFSARADGVHGTSMVAGGEISGTSNMTMAFCNNAVNTNFEVDYFKLVQ